MASCPTDAASNLPSGKFNSLPRISGFACHPWDENIWWVGGFAAFPLALFAVEDREFVPSPLTASEVLPGHGWDGKGAELFQGPFADALKTLFAAGFPDPAGLDYQKITIPTGNCYTGDSGEIETEGWLLPAGNEEPVFAIAWNGLIYPVVRTAGPADVQGSIKRLMAVSERPFGPFGWQGSEAGEVMPELAVGIHGMFLTRLGQPAAVDFLLKQRDHVPPDLTRTMADEWAWNLYDRAVCAHMRGDPRLALASLRELERIRPAIVKILTSGKPTNPPLVPLEWATQAEELKTECERRNKEGKTGKLDEAAFVANHPDVPALIGALDRVAVPQDGQPGWIEFPKSPIVKALIAADDKAVGPLLECLEKDRRLTQSVHFWRDFSQSRTVLGVHEAALVALEQILHTNYFQVYSTGANFTRGGDKARAEMAGKIRADLLAHGKATGADRAYQVLANDGAGAALWADAADSLFERGKRPDPLKPQPGEVLRDDRVPSVSDLLERRVANVVKSGEKVTADDERRRCRLLSCLLAWEPDRGRRVIGRQVDAWLADDNWEPLRSEAIVNFIESSAGDAPVVLRAFEAMAWKMKPDDYQDFHTGDFVTGILAGYGASPYLKRSREGLFTDPQSPWCLAKLSATKLGNLTEMWRNKKLVFREPFRSALLSALAEDSACAHAMLDPKKPSQWLYVCDNALHGHRIPDDKEFTLKPGMKIPVRRKDVVGKALSDPDPGKKAKAEPAMEYWWPKEKRDARIAEMLNLLSGPV